MKETKIHREVKFKRDNVNTIEVKNNAPKPSPIDLNSYVDDGISILDMIKSIPKIFQIIKVFYHLYKDITMSDDKISTIKGIIRAVVAIGGIIAAWAGFDIPVDAATILTTAVISVWALVELVLGIFQNKTPKTEAK